MDVIEVQRKRVVIATPRWSVDPPICADNRQETAFHLGYWQAQKDCPYEFLFGSVPNMMVQLARERIVEEALKYDAEYVAMVDDDMICPTNMWDQLLAHDVDVISPLAFMRQPPHYPVVYALHGGVDPVSKKEFFRNDVIPNYPKNQLFELDAVGFGAVLIKTSVFKGMTPYYFMSTTGQGEDIYFCLKARRAGFRIFCDSSIIIRHVGEPMIIDEHTYEQHNPDMVELREVSGDWSRAKADNNTVS